MTRYFIGLDIQEIDYDPWMFDTLEEAQKDLNNPNLGYRKDSKIFKITVEEFPKENA